MLILAPAAIKAEGNSCEQQDKVLEAEFVKRNDTIPRNDNVARLALIHSVSLRMRDIWLPCNNEKARNYEKTATDTLNTCLRISPNEALCKGINISDQMHSDTQTTAEEIADDPQVFGGGASPSPTKTKKKKK